MKTRILVLAFVSLLAVLCLRFWEKSTAPKAIITPHPPITAPTANDLLKPAYPIAATTINPSTTASPTAVPSPLSKEQMMSEKLAELNDQPIDFFGQVVDQYGQAVANTKVRGGVMVEKVWMGGNFADHYTTTDAAGKFVFRGLRGAEIVIVPSKEGYEFGGDKRSFYYSLLHHDNERHHPVPDTPVVFTMWKLQGAEPLINGNKFLGIKADGTPFTIDLLKGRKFEGRVVDGDLVVSVKQPTQIVAGQHFDWSFSIEVNGGGFILSDEAPYLNKAPEEGYQPRISQELKMLDREWSDVVKKTFFVKLRDGTVFGRVSAEIRANYQNAAVFSIRYLVNPKLGSRNLEYDPTKQISVR